MTAKGLRKAPEEHGRRESEDHKRKASSDKIHEISLEGIQLSDVDQMENDAVKEALKSVLRKDQLPQFHKDHGSHSNTHEA